MRNVSIILLVVIMSSCTTNFNLRNEIFSKNYDIYLKDDYQGINVGSYYIHNNVWGKNHIVNYKQGVFKTTEEDNVKFGWRWSWPESDGYTVRGYPEIIYGKNPWLQAENEYFPCQILDRKIKIIYNVELNSYGEHNIAFDIWLTNQKESSTDSISHEIMIWMFNENMSPGGVVKDKVVINDILFNVYVWENVTLGQPSGDRTYIAFVSNSPHLSAELDIDVFMNYLVENSLKIQTNNFITSESFIASIEFGTELVHGAGEIIFNNYEIVIE